jgi:acyl-coenzyme A thioesterase PaaI-like protein
VTIEERQNALLSMREQHHRTCPVCGDHNPNGLHTAFEVRPDGAVEVEVIYGEDKEGYDGHLHGGIIASLLDGAMTNCLFSYGIPAVTGELVVRMVHPVRAGPKIVVRAWLNRRFAPLYLMNAEMRQGGSVAAKGEGKFMRMAAEKTKH